MKRRGLLNKHFCKNKIQISPTRQQKLAIFTVFHYKSMGSISCHSNQSPYPIKTKTQLSFPPYLTPYIRLVKFQLVREFPDVYVSACVLAGKLFLLFFLVLLYFS